MTVTLLLLLSLVFYQVLAATAFMQPEMVSDVQQETMLDTVDSDDCAEHLGDQQAVEECTHCYCPVMIASCSSSAFFLTNSAFILPVTSLSYLIALPFDAWRSRALSVELRPPKITS